jgi:hypothetical protein
VKHFRKGKLFSHSYKEFSNLAIQIKDGADDDNNINKCNSSLRKFQLINAIIIKEK